MIAPTTKLLFNNHVFVQDFEHLRLDLLAEEVVCESDLIDKFAIREGVDEEDETLVVQSAR